MPRPPRAALPACRLVTFVGPAFWLSRQPGFEIRHVWYLSVATVTLQALMNLGLLRLEPRRRLADA